MDRLYLHHAASVVNASSSVTHPELRDRELSFPITRLLIVDSRSPRWFGIDWGTEHDLGAMIGSLCAEGFPPLLLGTDVAPHVQNCT